MSISDQGRLCPPPPQLNIFGFIFIWRRGLRVCLIHHLCCSKIVKTNAKSSNSIVFKRCSLVHFASINCLERGRNLIFLATWKIQRLSGVPRTGPTRSVEFVTYLPKSRHFGLRTLRACLKQFDLRMCHRSLTALDKIHQHGV